MQQPERIFHEDGFSLRDESFNFILEALTTMCHEMIAEESVDHLPPTVMVVTPQQGNYDNPSFNIEYVIVQGDFDQDTKHEVFHSIGRMFAKREVIVSAVFFTYEAWSIVRPAPDRSVAPSDAPDRKEKIVTFGLSSDANCVCSIADIERGKDGRMILSPPEYTFYHGEPNHIASNLLPYFYEGYISQITQGKLIEMMTSVSLENRQN